MVNEGATAGGPINSFTGQFMQVLPDDRDSYHSIYGTGSFTMTGLDWAFQVETPGLYSLFLRLWVNMDLQMHATVCLLLCFAGLVAVPFLLFLRGVWALDVVFAVSRATDDDQRSNIVTVSPPEVRH